MPIWSDSHVLMHAAAIISVAALAFRDQLRLRAVLLLSILLSAAYNDLKTPPGYQEIVWNAVTFRHQPQSHSPDLDGSDSHRQ